MNKYHNLLKGHKLNEKNIPYTINDLEEAIKYFESNEEYELCQKLHELKIQKLQHECNYTK